MKKVIFAAALALSFTGTAFAQSAAMQEAYEANHKPLAEGSGVTATGQETNSQATGHSAATNRSLEAVTAETNGRTTIEKSQSLDELNAEGQSVQAGDALENQ